jgi:hypothetical protein
MYLIEVTTAAPKFNNFDNNASKPYSFITIPENHSEAFSPFSILLLSLFKQYQKLFSVALESFYQKS